MCVFAVSFSALGSLTFLSSNASTTQVQLPISKFSFLSRDAREINFEPSLIVTRLYTVSRYPIPASHSHHRGGAAE